MKTYTITISDAQEKALAHVAVSPEFWIQNVVNVRCNAAIDEIVAEIVKAKLDAGEAITGSREDLVLATDIKSAAQVMAEYEAAKAAEQAAAEQAVQE